MMRIAVIGSGISGSLVARLLHSAHDVTLFEAAGYAGGHAHTVTVKIEDRILDVDTGFMVFNEKTYPHFCRMLHLLDVASQSSDMSFSVSCDRTGLEYQGSSLDGLFAQRSNLVNPKFFRMLLDVLRFNHYATRAIQEDELGESLSVNDFLTRHGFSEQFVWRYLFPMSASIWSSRPESIADFPAVFLLRFFHNHGLIQLLNRPKWKTIVGGSRQYVTKLLQPLGERVRLGTPVESIRRTPFGVDVYSGGGIESFDQVVLATHADESLKLLSDATNAEQQVLGAFPFQANEAVLHTDTSQLPRRQPAWASWNYRVPKGAHGTATVTYDLNRLQRLGLRRPLLLTLNPAAPISRDRILKHFTYHHPSYTRASFSAQKLHSAISGMRQRTHYCGAYWGYGFHEDGVNSALSVTREFGIGLEQCTAASTKVSSLIGATCQ